MIEGLLSDGNVEGGAKLASDLLDIFNIGKEPDELVLSLVANDEASLTATAPTNLAELLDNIAGEVATVTDPSLIT